MECECQFVTHKKPCKGEVVGACECCSRDLCNACNAARWTFGDVNVGDDAAGYDSYQDYLYRFICSRCFRERFGTRPLQVGGQLRKRPEWKWNQGVQV